MDLAQQTNPDMLKTEKTMRHVCVHVIDATANAPT